MLVASQSVPVPFELLQGFDAFDSKKAKWLVNEKTIATKQFSLLTPIRVMDLPAEANETVDQTIVAARSFRSIGPPDHPRVAPLFEAGSSRFPGCFGVPPEKIVIISPSGNNALLTEERRGKGKCLSPQNALLPPGRLQHNVQRIKHLA